MGVNKVGETKWEKTKWNDAIWTTIKKFTQWPVLKIQDPNPLDSWVEMQTSQL